MLTILYSQIRHRSPDTMEGKLCVISPDEVRYFEAEPVHRDRFRRCGNPHDAILLALRYAEISGDLMSKADPRYSARQRERAAYLRELSESQQQVEYRESFEAVVIEQVAGFCGDDEIEEDTKNLPWISIAPAGANALPPRPRGEAGGGR